ncbi:MAG: CBS domain-containing protein [Spirochaetales bacterium]|nr:CBS domain-containing protein [Spirochaetales bacterium]
MDRVPIDTDTGAKVVLELIYRLKVSDVMTPAPVAATEDRTLREIQTLMRERRITGVPIVNKRGGVAGMVSIGDIIEALDSGYIEDRAGERMTRQVLSLEAGMPLSFAISWLNRYRFGRFPVVDRDGLLVGIITSKDIIRALLLEMNGEVERLENEIRSGHGEAETASPDGTVSLCRSTLRWDFETAGKASAGIKKALKDAGIDPAIVRRAAIASYELEMNQVIHSWGGTIECRILGDRLEIAARDGGPGIADLEAALREGFSTADEWIRSLGFGAGMGLPNVRRSADDFFIDSTPGRGTTVQVTIRLDASPDANRTRGGAESNGGDA